MAEDQIVGGGRMASNGFVSIILWRFIYKLSYRKEVIVIITITTLSHRIKLGINIVVEWMVADREI